jgi:Zn-dependent metalloprotease
MKNKRWLRLFAVLSVLMVPLWPVSSYALGYTQFAQVTEFNAKTTADQYLKQHAADYHFRPDLADLKHVATIEENGNIYVRYQQTVNRVPAFTRQVTVTMNPFGKVLFVVSNYTQVKQVEANGKKAGRIKAWRAKR